MYEARLWLVDKEGQRQVLAFYHYASGDCMIFDHGIRNE